MEQLDQFQIIQEIASRAISAAEPGWTELMINYHVEGPQSDFGNSYLVSEDGRLKEKPLPFVDELDPWLRQLQAHLALGGKQPFTSCQLHLWADGKFDTAYGYGKVDWDGLVDAGWNFPAAAKG
jgi:hypothetical protein